MKSEFIHLLKQVIIKLEGVNNDSIFLLYF